jgi:subtilisin family serine protease
MELAMQPHRIIIRSLLPTLICCLLPALCFSVAAAGITPDLEASLQSMDPENAVAVIVTFAADGSTTAAALQGGRRSRAAALRSLHATARTRRQQVSTILGTRGVLRTRSLWLIDALAVTATPETIRRLAAVDGVADVRIDRRHRKEDILMALTDAPEGNISQVGAPALWTLGHFGQGTTVGLMDSGAELQHPDLSATWRGGTNSWLDPYGQYATPVDPDTGSIDAGHGTAVLGIMVGGDAGGTTIGTAPKARWIAARMFDDSDSVTDSVIHQIFQWFLDPDGDPDTDDAPDVINGSWGLLDPDGQAGACIDDLQDDFRTDVTLLNAAGIATVFAGGNYGPSVSGSTTAPGSISPANYADAIAVGAVNSSDEAASFSSLGPSACDGRIYPDVVAPGVAVKTTYLSANYVYISGTSFSTPHASGALALLAGAFPLASLAELKEALLGSAVDLGDAGPDNVYGNGRIAMDDTTGAFAYLRDTVGKSPCVRPEVSFSAAPEPGPGTLGESITFTATVAGSGGPYTYAWDIDGDGAADSTTSTTGTSSTFEHTYGAAYTGSVGLTVTDAAASDCPASLVIADQWSCPAMTATITAQPDPATTDQQITLTGSISGSASPYTYSWDLNGDGKADCTSATCTQTYTTAASPTVALTITDASGCSASAQKTLTVVPAPPISTGSGGGGSGCFVSALYSNTNAGRRSLSR